MNYYFIDRKDFSAKDKAFYIANVLCTDHIMKYFVKRVFITKEIFDLLGDDYSAFDEISHLISVNLSDNGYTIIINR